LAESSLRLKAIFDAIDRFSGPMRRMETRTRSMARAMKMGLGSVTGATSVLISGLRRVATTAGIAAGALGLVARNIAGTGIDYEQAITNVGAVMRKTREEIKPLDMLAQQLGKTTKFTAVEAASGMELLARAGFSVEENMAAIPGVLAAAAASGDDLALTTDNVIAVLKGMRMPLEQAGLVADTLTVASTKTNSTITSLAESMRNVAPVASQLKIPMKDAVAAVALLQDVGLDASQAGTATATMLTKLATVTPKTAAKLKQMGVAFQRTNGDALPLRDILGNLAKAAQKSGGNMKQVALFAELVGMRGQRAALNLQDMGKRGKFAELIKELQGVTGAADDVANKRMDTTRGSITLLKSAVDGLKVKLFETEGGPLRKVIDGMTKWVGENEALIVQKVSEWVQKFKDNLPEIVKWTKRIAAGVAVLYGVHIAATIASGAVTVFEGALTICSGAARLFMGVIRLVRAAVLSETAATIGAAIATGAKTAATWLLNAALWLGELATKRFTAASILSTAASWLHVAAAKARAAAVWLVHAAISAAKFVVGLFTGATHGATIASVANTIAEKARAAATWLSSAASKAAGLAAGVYAVATGGATTATTLFTGAAGRLAIALGAVAAAVGSIALAYDQYSKLKAEVGGDIGAVWDKVKGGKGLFEAVDETMNEQARARQAAKSKLKTVGAGGPGEIPGMSPETAAALQALTAGYGAGLPMVAPPSEHGTGTGTRVGVEGPAGFGTKQSQAMMAAMAAAQKPQKIEGEITIKDETNRAEVTKQPKSGSGRLRLQHSGAF
jgi:TP901 family phage tail tape measure protein